MLCNMEQLTLPFASESSPQHRVRFFRNDDELFSLGAGPIAEAQALRRDLVELLQRDPRNRTVWEDNPRPTGWWGLKSSPPQPATVYTIIIESIDWSE